VNWKKVSDPDKKQINIKGIGQDIKVLEEIVVEAAKKRAELEEKIKALEEEKARLRADIAAIREIWLRIIGLYTSILDAEIDKLEEEKKALEEKAAPAEAPAPAEEKPSE